jgi:hypothetical protein
MANLEAALKRTARMELQVRVTAAAERVRCNPSRDAGTLDSSRYAQFKLEAAGVTL